jgi:hypothetical protein
LLFFENGRQTAHQFLFLYNLYEIDEQETEPVLVLADCLKNYHNEGTGNAAYQHLVLTEEVRE